MSNIIKQNEQVTVTDITEEAHIILATAKNGFVSDDYKKMAYLRDRVWYWTGLGFTKEEANKKAQEDYEWTK